MKSYAAIIDSPKCSAGHHRARPRLTPGLGLDVRGDVPLDTNLINVTVDEHDPAQAAAIADAVSAQFATYIGEIEQADSTGRLARQGQRRPPGRGPRRRRSRRGSSSTSRSACSSASPSASALAVLRENLDTSVKDEDDIEAISHDIGRPLNVIGAIGKDSAATKTPLIVNADPQSKRAEAFRQLRTNLQFVDVDNPPRSIVITSSLAVEGKSTTAANLAITLAQAGLRVALVEADLRRPKLADYMGVEGAVGLTDVLVGRGKVDDLMQPWGNLPLSFLPSGRPAPNPSELLGSRAMLTLLQELEAQFDIVLLDAPPLLPVTDAAVMSALAGGALLVVRVGSTTRDQVEEAADALHSVDARLLGVVLSMVPEPRPQVRRYDYEYAYPTDDRRRRAPQPARAHRERRATTYQRRPRRPRRRTRRGRDRHEDQRS